MNSDIELELSSREKLEAHTVGGTMSRRNFLQLAAFAVAAPKVLLSGQKAPSVAYHPVIPSHLPSRLAICYYGWGWITTARPDEPFGNLDQALKETRERGFNCVRAEMGLDWMFNLHGERRGRLKFRDWIPGLSSNLQCVNGKGGATFDVFDRVIELFELAAKHDIYVIMTSWEYQDAISHLADRRIADEILAVPYSDRLMLLARQYGRLLEQLKKRGLHKHIAQVEIINELNTPPIVCSPTPLPPETYKEWTHRMRPKPGCSTDEVRKLAFDAVDYVRHRHPDLLVTVDGLVSGYSLETLLPDNAQVADHHAYSEGLVQAFWEKVGISGFGPGEPPNPEKNSFLKSVLKPNPIPWNEFIKRAENVRQEWWSIGWLYANLDNNRFDDWCVSHFSEYELKIKDSLNKQFELAAKFAKPRNLPLIIDEGYILYPPLNSRFVTTPQGRRGEEYGVDGAIATGHWGILPTAYFRPDTPVWKDEAQSEWIRRLNKKILDSGRPVISSAKGGRQDEAVSVR